MRRVYKILAVLSFVLIINEGLAQTPAWVWVKEAGGVSNEYSNATCSDANGNVYITGTFQGSTIIFGNDTLHNVNTGTLDVFVVKYDANGNVIWARSGGGTDRDYAYGIAVDKGGNVCVTGYFRSSSINFGPITLTSASAVSYNIFIIKYDPMGNLVWAKREGGRNEDRGWSICTDADSNIYVTGMFGSDTVVFGSYTLTKIGNGDIFIVKYDPGGNVLWAKGIGGIGPGGSLDSGMGICSDISGNIYVTGFFAGAANFPSNYLVGLAMENTFVAKYDTYGNNIWAKYAPGGGGGYGITTDAKANVYITGFFYNYISFGSDTLGNSGNWSIFTAKYDSSGSALWGRTPGGNDLDFGSSICSDINGNVFVTGYFRSSFLNFGGFPLLNSFVGHEDIFVTEYDSSGNVLWATGIGGPDYDYGMGICSNTTGDVYVTGYLGSFSLNFGNITITNNGSYDVFLAKLSTPVGMNESFQNKDYNSFIFSPNPATTTFTITTTMQVLATLTLYDLTGRAVLRQGLNNHAQVEVSTLARGMYIAEVRHKNGNVAKGKLVKE